MELASHILKKNKVNLTKLPLKLEIEVLGTTPPSPHGWKLFKTFFYIFGLVKNFRISLPPPSPLSKTILRACNSKVNM